MSILASILKAFGIAICSQIPMSGQPISESKLFEGSSIAEISVFDEQHVKIKKYISLQKVSNKFQFAYKKIEPEFDYSGGINGNLLNEGIYDAQVLDQGQYGTCVTFSTTSAIQAAKNSGGISGQLLSPSYERISEQCSLQLLLGLGQNLWHGAYFPSQIIEPLKSVGVVTEKTCPNKYPNPYAFSNIEEHMRNVDKSYKIDDIKYQYYSVADLNVLKKKIDEKKYVAIGFLLAATQDPVSVQGHDVVINGERFSGGLWACKQRSSKNYCGAPQGGHEVVVYGYDDVQKLLKIRNSWGSGSGYKGDYYMTYQYFSLMAQDMTAIWKE